MKNKREKKMNPSVKTLIIVGLMLGIASAVVTVSGDTFLHNIFGHGKQESMYNLIGFAVWIVKRLIYIWLATSYGTEGLGELTGSISDLVMLNPPISGLHNLMKTSIEFVFVLYIPAIASTGFYILFLSSSPKGRAKAKAMLTRLIIGLIIISITPQLMELLLKTSEGLTSAILAPTGKEAFTGTWDTTLGTTLPPSGLKGMHFIATFIEVELGFYTFLFFMVLVWGAFIFPLVIRFLIVSMLIIMFPLATLLYSFEFSKTLGRMMLEQTFIWIFLQAINALIVLTIIQSMLSLPEDFLRAGWGPLTIAVIPFMGCMLFSVAPVFIIRFFKGFLP